MSPDWVVMVMSFNYYKLSFRIEFEDHPESLLRTLQHNVGPQVQMVSDRIHNA